MVHPDTLQERDAEISAVIHETLLQVNPCRLELDIRHGDPRAYEKFVPHIGLLIRNGCGEAEIADYVEKQMLQTGVKLRSRREMAVSAARAILAAVLAPKTLLERTRER